MAAPGIRSSRFRSAFLEIEMKYTIKEVAVSLTIVSVLTLVMLARDTLSTLQEKTILRGEIGLVGRWMGSETRDRGASAGLRRSRTAEEAPKKGWSSFLKELRALGGDPLLAEESRAWQAEGPDAVLDRLEDLAPRLDRCAEPFLELIARAPLPSKGPRGLELFENWQGLGDFIRIASWKAVAVAMGGREDEGRKIFGRLLPIVLLLREGMSPILIRSLFHGILKDLSEALRAIVSGGFMAEADCEALCRSMLPIAEDLDRRKLVEEEKSWFRAWRSHWRRRWPRGWRKLSAEGLGAGKWMAIREGRLLAALGGPGGRPDGSARLKAPADESSCLLVVGCQWPSLEARWRESLFSFRAALAALAIRGKWKDGPWPAELSELPSEIRFDGPDGSPLAFSSRGKGFTLSGTVEGRRREWSVEIWSPVAARRGTTLPSEIDMPDRYVPSVTIGNDEEELPSVPMRITAIVGRPPRCMAVLVHGDSEYVVQKGWRSRDGRFSVTEMTAITVTVRDGKTGRLQRLFAP